MVKLTETDLHNLIKDCINEASKEMDGAIQIDNRIAPIWNKFIEQLKMAIESRKPKDKESQTN